MYSRFLILIIVVLQFGCISIEEQEGKGLLPKASGQKGEIILVMDSAKWNGTLGEEIKKTFRPIIPNISPDEYLFTIRQVNPLKLNSVLKSATNMIFVFTLDDRSRGSRSIRGYFTENSLKMIQEDTSRFFLNEKDEFARGQEVLYLFGKDDNTLIRNIQKNRSRLQDFFNQVERRRLVKELYKAKEKKGITKNILDDHQFSIRVPDGYRLEWNDDNFVWIRNTTTEWDKNVFVTYKPYESEASFEPDSIVSWRNSIARQRLFENPDNPESYLVTDDKNLPLIIRPLTFEGKYSMETTGWWQTNTITMGGPFVSYVFVDEELSRIYYIEGFLYRPGKTKREFLRELSTIIYTFRTESELNGRG